MKLRRPPRLAEWLLKTLGCSSNNNAVLGDLAERYSVKQAAAWYWQQSLAAISASFVQEIREHKLQATTAVAAGWLALVSSWFVQEAMFGNPLGWRRHVCMFVWFISGSISGCIVAFASKQSARPMVLLYSISILAFLLVIHPSPSKANPANYWIDVAVITLSTSLAGLWAASTSHSIPELQKEKA